MIPIYLYGAPRELPTYIPQVGFSMLSWILATFLTYSFYSSSHHTEIPQSTARFIYVILSSQQFDIGQVIIDIIIL